MSGAELLREEERRQAVSRKRLEAEPGWKTKRGRCVRPAHFLLLTANAIYSRGSVTPRCAWYFPFLSL